MKQEEWMIEKFRGTINKTQKLPFTVALLIATSQKFDGNAKYEKKLWFVILTTRYKSNPKSTVWSGSEKLMSVKIHAHKKVSIAKIYSGIRKYFVKQREICVFYLRLESRILPAA